MTLGKKLKQAKHTEPNKNIKNCVLKKCFGRSRGNSSVLAPLQYPRTLLLLPPQCHANTPHWSKQLSANAWLGGSAGDLGDNVHDCLELHFHILGPLHEMDDMDYSIPSMSHFAFYDNTAAARLIQVSTRPKCCKTTRKQFPYISWLDPPVRKTIKASSK